MPRIKKKYNFTNGREIWRLIPTKSSRLVIEERDLKNKEAFYNCVDIDSGKKLFSNFQLDEKFWTGIEAVENDVILFHKFIKPDMPIHKGLIAFDITSQRILWQNDEFNFLYSTREKIFCYRQSFESRNYFTINVRTGQLLDDLGEDHKLVNQLKNNLVKQTENNYSFPESFSEHSEIGEAVSSMLKQVRTDYVVVGKIDFMIYNSALLFNFHEAAGENLLNNKFIAIDISSGKNIFEEVLNKKIKSLIPDSFFMIGDVLFLLKNKNEVIVCSVL